MTAALQPFNNIWYESHDYGINNARNIFCLMEITRLLETQQKKSKKNFASILQINRKPCWSILLNECHCLCQNNVQHTILSSSLHKTCFFCSMGEQTSIIDCILTNDRHLALFWQMTDNWCYFDERQWRSSSKNPNKLWYKKGSKLWKSTYKKYKIISVTLILKLATPLRA